MNTKTNPSKEDIEELRQIFFEDYGLNMSFADAEKYVPFYLALIGEAFKEFCKIGKESCAEEKRNI